MEIKLSTTLANEDNQEALNAFAKVIRREGKILERFDTEKTDGHHTGFFVEWQGAEYFIRMHNGQTKRVRKLIE